MQNGFFSLNGIDNKELMFENGYFCAQPKPELGHFKFFESNL